MVTGERKEKKREKLHAEHAPCIVQSKNPDQR